jgi:hypothetical protein
VKSYETNYSFLPYNCKKVNSVLVKATYAKPKAIVKHVNILREESNLPSDIKKRKASAYAKAFRK